jgi:hypothetical protein
MTKTWNCNKCSIEPGTREGFALLYPIYRQPQSTSIYSHQHMHVALVHSMIGRASYFKKTIHLLLTIENLLEEKPAKSADIFYRNSNRLVADNGTIMAHLLNNNIAKSNLSSTLDRHTDEYSTATK